MGKHKERNPIIVERNGVKVEVYLGVIRVEEYLRKWTFIARSPYGVNDKSQHL